MFLFSKRNFTGYYNERDQINEEVTSKKYSALVWRKKHMSTWSANLNGWANVGNVRLSSAKILKWTMNKEDGCRVGSAANVQVVQIWIHRSRSTGSKHGLLLILICTAFYHSVLSNNANFVKKEQTRTFKGGLHWIEILAYCHWQKALCV